MMDADESRSASCSTRPVVLFSIHANSSGTTPTGTTLCWSTWTRAAKPERRIEYSKADRRRRVDPLRLSRTAGGTLSVAIWTRIAGVVLVNRRRFWRPRLVRTAGKIDHEGLSLRGSQMRGPEVMPGCLDPRVAFSLPEATCSVLGAYSWQALQAGARSRWRGQPP